MSMHNPIFSNHYILIQFILIALAAGFIALTFLQSGLDKIFDYEGNLKWMSEQFSKTFLNGTIGIFLPVLAACELVSGLLCTIGIAQFFLRKGEWILTLGFATSGLTLLMLLFGQRISKQYAGAVSLTGYFIIVLIGLIAELLI